MGLQTGVVGELWVLHHTLGHHKNYLDQSKDESAWQEVNGRTMRVFEYTFKVGMTTYQRGLEVGKQYPRERKKLIQNIVVTIVAIAFLTWYNWFNALAVYILPMLILLFATVFDTYKHHAGLDTEDPYQATYNVLDPTYNWLHWAELPELHEQIKDKIPQSLYRQAGFPFPQVTRLTTLTKNLVAIISRNVGSTVK